MLVACLSHDAGYNRQETVEVPLSLLYGKKGEFGSHHISSLIQIAAKKQCNIFQCFDDEKDNNKKELNDVWKIVIDLILATDMSLHFDLMDQIQKAAADDGSFKKTENRLLLMKLFVMMCDISNLARPPEFANKAKDVMSQDFFNCGADLERLTGIDNAALKDIKKLDEEKRLFPFIISVCIPIFKCVTEIFPNLKYLYDQVRSNMQCWNLPID